MAAITLLESQHLKAIEKVRAEVSSSNANEKQHILHLQELLDVEERKYNEAMQQHGNRHEFEEVRMRPGQVQVVR